MSTPQERIAEYLQKHYSGGEGWSPMYHAAKICKLFAVAIDETVRMNTRQECIAEYLERHIDNSESECKELADEIFTLTIADIVEENDRLKAIVNAPCVKVSDKVYDEFAMMAKLQTLEAAFAQMREALLDERSEIIRGGRNHVEERRMSIIDSALSSDCGKEFLDRLNGLDRQTKDDKEYIEDLCSQLCKMEDALGFRNDCQDKDGAFVPTIGPWLERVRDLIAHEGELGDAKERLNKLEAESAAMREVIEHAGCHDHGDGDERDCSLCQAVNSILDSTNAGKSMLDRLHAMDDKLKTAASMLRSAVYERTPLGDKWIDHFDVERQKAITEFLASVEGKP